MDRFAFLAHDTSILLADATSAFLRWTDRVFSKKVQTLQADTRPEAGEPT
jgi:hypothetical protein